MHLMQLWKYNIVVAYVMCNMVSNVVYSTFCFTAHEAVTTNKPVYIICTVKYFSLFTKCIVYVVYDGEHS